MALATLFQLILGQAHSEVFKKEVCRLRNTYHLRLLGISLLYYHSLNLIRKSDDDDTNSDR